MIHIANRCRVFGILLIAGCVGALGCSGEADTASSGQGGGDGGVGGGTGGGGGAGGGSCEASEEICDGIDNDCDLLIDEELNDVTCGLGACQVTVPACVNGKPGECVPLPPATSEVCEGTDDDCDGAVDEDCACLNGASQDCYSGPMGTQGVGTCAGGTQVCEDGAWGPCVGDITPASEACDGLDSNCEGQVDEGNPGGGIACMTGLQGVCSPGMTACQSGSVVCVQNVAPSPEACDNLDNNCDGEVDEGDPGGGLACMTGLVGACAAGTTACQNGSTACVQNVPSSAEVCDAVDNDCNGQVDEGNPGGGGACMTGQQGICAPGTLNCQGGSLVCQQNAQASPEECGDSLDNNCDGQVNEGCPVCNTSVLLLSDNNAGITNSAAVALTAAGLSPTVVHGGIATYNGAPPAASFSAVLLLVGDEYLVDMPVAGQNSIVSAFNNGTTGVLFTEWAAYKPTTGQWTALSQLLILNRSGENSVGSETQTYTQTIAHPIWAGIPNSFTTVFGAAPVAFNVGMVINGGSSIATVSAPGCFECPAPGVVVKDGPSRTVQIAHSASYVMAPWINDANLKLMLTNGAKWVAECP